jgi:hypothetical protein
VEKPEGKKPLGRPRRRRKDNIKMDLQEVGCEAILYPESILVEIVTQEKLTQK